MSGLRQVTEMPVDQLFRQLAIEVEDITRSLGHEFRWLRVQSLRSSESVLANMTEGFYSQYSTEYLQCLYRSRREARETMGHIRYAVDVRQMAQETADKTLSSYEDALTQLSSLIGSIEGKIREKGKAKEYPMLVRELGAEYLMIEEDLPSTI